MRGRAPTFIFALAVMLGAAVGPAGAANLFELNFFLSGPRYDGVLPPCDSEAALGKISSRFAHKEGTFWNSSLTIQGFEKVRETASRPWAVNNIPRRFCSAIALVSDDLPHIRSTLFLKCSLSGI